MSCLFYRQEREHILFHRGPLLQIWAVGVERGIYGGSWLCVSSFILEIVGWNCVKANSCEKFEAKISEKSEKKGSEYLKRTSEFHVKRVSVRLLFALKRKIFFKRNGRTLIWWSSHLVREPNSTSGGHEFKSHVWRELDELTRVESSLGSGLSAKSHFELDVPIADFRVLRHEAWRLCLWKTEIAFGSKRSGFFFTAASQNLCII
jgi:hypothetical protein